MMNKSQGIFLSKFSVFVFSVTSLLIISLIFSQNLKAQELEKPVQTALIHIIANPISLDEMLDSKNPEELKQGAKLEMHISIGVTDYKITTQKAAQIASASTLERVNELNSKGYNIEAIQIESDYGHNNINNLGLKILAILKNQKQIELKLAPRNLRSELLHPSEITALRTASEPPVLALTRLKGLTSDLIKAHMEVTHIETKEEKIKASFKKTNIFASLLRYAANGAAMYFMTYHPEVGGQLMDPYNLMHAVTFGLVGGGTSSALMLTSPFYLSWMEKRGLMYEQILSALTKTGLGSPRIQEKTAASMNRLIKWGGILELGFISVLEITNVVFGVDLFSEGVATFAWKIGKGVALTIASQGIWEFFIQNKTTLAQNEIKRNSKHRESEILELKAELLKMYMDAEKRQEIPHVEVQELYSKSVEIKNLLDEIEHEEQSKISHLNIKRSLSIMGVSITSVGAISALLMGQNMLSYTLYGILIASGLSAPHLDKALSRIYKYFSESKYEDSKIYKFLPEKFKKIKMSNSDLEIDAGIRESFIPLEDVELSSKVEFMKKSDEQVNRGKLMKMLLTVLDKFNIKYKQPLSINEIDLSNRVIVNSAIRSKCESYLRGVLKAG